MVGWGPSWQENHQPFEYAIELQNYVFNRYLQESFKLQQSEKMLYQAMQQPEYYVISMLL